MARYTGPVCRLCRREGEKLFLKGARCMSPKCSFERRSYPPGQHGKDAQFRRGRGSDYALQLREKQKARRVYGILERQFRRYFREALRRPGLTGRICCRSGNHDNVITAWLGTGAITRPLVQHGHGHGRRTNIPSYLVAPGDEITVREGSRKRAYFKELRAYAEDRPRAPEWLSVDTDAMKATITRVPERRDVDLPLNEQLIVEYYSR
jgi:small subunit ribosomal protein S4